MPDLAVSSAALNNIICDSGASVISWWVPGQEARLVGDLRDVEGCRRTRLVYVWKILIKLNYADTNKIIMKKDFSYQLALPRMFTSTVAVARPLLLVASIIYVELSSLTVLAMVTVECPGLVSMETLSSALRTRSALVHFTRGSGLPVTSAGSSILLPALAVRPASSLASRWICGGSAWTIRTSSWSQV